MPSLADIIRDVRALGASAPIRAVYEASKRTNLHSVLFRDVKGGYRSKPLRLGAQAPDDDAIRQRCLEDARLVLDEGTRVFGHRAATGVSASWAMDPFTERCWPEQTPWWQIDIRSDARLSDVKFAWEAARHRDLVILARASAIDRDGPWREGLIGMLVRWCRECRPEEGVHWYSSLELALRAIAWNQVLWFVGDRLHGGLRAELDDQLVASARHMMVELPYTMSSMKNNHLLGDGLGLVLLGSMFPSHPRSSTWRSVGDKLMLKQLRNHMLPDGSMIEDSLSYHRFVLEMFIVRVLIGDAPRPIRAATQSAAGHLITLGAAEEDVPQYGDWDEGRVLADSRPAGDVAGAAHLALHLSGQPTPDAAWRTYDELAWYADPASARSVSAEAPEATWASGQFSGAMHGPWRVWLKRTLTPSHQHADLSSVWIQHDGAWVLRDPGTGTYNGPIQVRDGFRTSAAHPLWRPRGVDLLGPHRAFRWRRHTVPSGHGHLDLGDATLMVVWHDGFTEGRSLRMVLVEADGVTVIDRIPTGAQSWVMTVPEGEAAELLTGVDGERIVGQEEPFTGWMSRTYGDWQPSPWREITQNAGWHVWGAGRPRALTSTQSDRVSLEGVEASVRSGADDVVIELLFDSAKHSLEASRA